MTEPPREAAATQLQKRRKGAGPGLVLRLAIADMWHEWILTLCIILAIAAVISPLLLLFGLKYGTIDTLRKRLMEDPQKREVRPLASRTFERAWFEEIAARPDVGFVMPLTRQIATTVTIAKRGMASTVNADMIPTGDNDALLVDHQVTVPTYGQCVLSHFAAEEMEAAAGDTITVTATRIKGSRYERVTVDLVVSGSLPLRASGLKAMYVPLKLLEQVEQYKDGQAVVELGWPGKTPKAYPQFNGCLVITEKPLPSILQLKLRTNTGFTKIEEIAPGALQQTAGFSITNGHSVYRLFTTRRPVGETSVDNVRRRLRGMDAVVIPWVAPLAASLQTGEEGEAPLAVTLLGLSLSDADQDKLGLTPRLPWPNETKTMRPLLSIMLPESLSTASSTGVLTVAFEEQETTVPVSILPTRSPAPGIALIPSPLAGVLRLLQYRPVRYADEAGDFLLYRRGYAGFRLYARSIDDVDGLRQHFEALSIPVSTAAAQIEGVREMNRYLTLIFWLIAAGGIAGSVASLVASLYASVERKKRELSVLRLLGFSGTSLFLFPIYQGALIAAGAFGAAVAFFRVISLTINHLFRSHLQQGESFCALPYSYAGLALAATVLLACISAMVAVMRLSRIEPGEALRDE